MSNFFGSEEIKEFLELVQKPVRSSEELLINVKRAIMYIANDMHMGKVVISLSVPQSKLRAQIENLTSILYQSDVRYSFEPINLSYRTGDGGTVLITFYPQTDYKWNEEEQREIRIVGNHIYGAFRQQSMEGLLKKAMTTDLAVGLPNVSGFMSFATQLFAQGILNEYVAFFFNIHNFKYVNKVLQHMQADEVMRIYAGMLANMVESDEIAARLGGDNFVALIREENVNRFVSLISCMDITYQYENEVKKFSFGATIGASKLNDIQNPGDILLRTSISYQMARQQDSGEVVYYNEEYYKIIMRQKEIIAGFQKALETQEFVVYYQPKVSTEDKSINGAEALVRWKTAEGQLIQPAEFIPILEKNGSICKLDFYVLDKVCELLKKCSDQGIPMTRISINYSRKHVGNPDLVREIVSTIDRHSVPHEYVEIELTESEDFRDYIVMAKLIDDLKKEGICTSIDDFGTGYSSLNMLKMTSIDILKIDKSFIPLEEDYPDKKKDCIMFENIAHLAKALGYLVIAEGVETQKQYEYLASVGCDIIQGFYFDKPLPEEKFLEKILIGHY